MPDHRATRRAVYGCAFNKNPWQQEQPEDLRRILDWYAKRLDGKTAAASVIHRKPRVRSGSGDGEALLEFAHRPRRDGPGSGYGEVWRRAREVASPSTN